MATYKYGLKKQKTYDEAEIDASKEVYIRRPDRLAKILRNSPQMSQLDGEFEDIESIRQKMLANEIIRQQKIDFLKHHDIIGNNHQLARAVAGSEISKQDDEEEIVHDDGSYLTIGAMEEVQELTKKGLEAAKAQKLKEEGVKEFVEEQDTALAKYTRAASSSAASSAGAAQPLIIEKEIEEEDTDIVREKETLTNKLLKIFPGYTIDGRIGHKVLKEILEYYDKSKKDDDMKKYILATMYGRINIFKPTQTDETPENKKGPQTKKKVRSGSVPATQERSSKK